MMGQKRERLGKWCFLLAAILCVCSVLAIFLFLIARSLPAFRHIGLSPFLLGNVWTPDRTDRYGQLLSGSYGIFPMLVSSLTATLGALIIGGALGILTAVFLVFYCPKRLRRAFALILRLLAGIPSVVFGFFGVILLLPLLSHFAPNNGSGLLATSLILGIMILPTVASLSENALNGVQKSIYEGSRGLGCGHGETALHVMLPAAKSGISASLILGIGRALGETMAVVMVAGNAPTHPTGLFGSFRTLTANIVMEMGYAGEVQEGALVATGVVLLFLILGINLVFGIISKQESRRKTAVGIWEDTPLKRFQTRLSYAFYGKKAGALLRCGAFLSASITVSALLTVIAVMFFKGVPVLLRSPQLIFGQYSFGSHRITLLPAIVTTLYAVALSLLIAVPIGVMTAIYLQEYAKRSHRSVRLIRTAINILSGVPSIVYGLFGMITFVKLLGGSASILAGALTVSMMLLPVIVRSVEESLMTVPQGLREGSHALGAGKLRTVWKIVLPSALSGICSAVILSMSRVISESAPFLYTMGSVLSDIPKRLSDSGATLAVALYQLSGEGWYLEEAYGATVVLILMALLLNLLAEWLMTRRKA